MYISYVAKARLFTAVFSQLSIFTADCLRHPIQMAGVETIWELHSLPVIYSWCYVVELNSRNDEIFLMQKVKWQIIFKAKIS